MENNIELFHELYSESLTLLGIFSRPWSEFTDGQFITDN